MTIEEQIQALKDLKPDWNGYGADPPSAKSIDLAEKLARYIVQGKTMIHPIRLVPDASNGVTVYIYGYDPNKMVSVAFFNDYEYSILYFDRITNASEEVCFPGDADDPVVTHMLTKLGGYSYQCFSIR